MIKKSVWLLLGLLLVSSVCAATFFRDTVIYTGTLSPSDPIICDRDAGGIAHFRDRLHKCFLDSTHDGFWQNNEQVLGFGKKIGDQMMYIWPTDLFKYSQSYYNKRIDCDGVVILTEPKADRLGLFNALNCTQHDSIGFCCPEDIFPAKENSVFLAAPPVYVDPRSTSLLVVSKTQWDRVRFGMSEDLFVEKAVRTEKQRCANNEGDLFIWDTSFGGFFSDKSNYHDGERVFLFTKPDYEITPLISWCDQ
ncbi:hypothetical protein KY329_05250 [Candidatus Woesearchaeota archaeon]|nr:hypothetical protein [Candidatus Woesearchaeota archaeon]